VLLLVLPRYKLISTFLITVILYMAIYGYAPYHQGSQLLRVWVSDGPGMYHMPTIKFTAITIYGMVHSPSATASTTI